MKKIVVWHNLNKNTYYYRIVKCSYRDYEVGFINQYNHEVILNIDIYKEFTQFYRMPLKKRVIKKAISFLHKLDKKF